MAGSVPPGGCQEKVPDTSVSLAASMWTLAPISSMCCALDTASIAAFFWSASLAAPAAAFTSMPTPMKREPAGLTT